MWVDCEETGRASQKVGLCYVLAGSFECQAIYLALLDYSVSFVCKVILNSFCCISGILVCLSDHLALGLLCIARKQVL